MYNYIVVRYDTIYPCHCLCITILLSVMTPYTNGTVFGQVLYMCSYLSLIPMRMELNVFFQYHKLFLERCHYLSNFSSTLNSNFRILNNVKGIVGLILVGWPL